MSFSRMSFYQMSFYEMLFCHYLTLFILPNVFQPKVILPNVILSLSYLLHSNKCASTECHSTKCHSTECRRVIILPFFICCSLVFVDFEWGLIRPPRLSFVEVIFGSGLHSKTVSSFDLNFKNFFSILYGTNEAASLESNGVYIN